MRLMTNIHARGEGVRLLADPREAPRSPGWLVQEYIARPYLRRTIDLLSRGRLDPTRMTAAQRGELAMMLRHAACRRDCRDNVARLRALLAPAPGDGTTIVHFAPAC